MLVFLPIVYVSLLFAALPAYGEQVTTDLDVLDAAPKAAGNEDPIALIARGFGGLWKNIGNKVEEATHTVELFFANVTSITLPSTPESLTVINSWGAIVQNYTTKILGENEDIQSVAAKIRSFETCVQVLVAYAQASEGDLQAVLGGDAASSARFLEELAVAYQSLAVDIGIDGPLPLAVRTVSPEQRRIMTKNILIQAERVSLDLAAQHGVPQEQSQSLQSYFHNLGSYVEMLVSITEDVAENHPALFAVFMFTVGALFEVVLGQVPFLRLLLNLIGFAPPPIEGGLAAAGFRLFKDLIGGDGLDTKGLDLRALDSVPGLLM